MMPSSASSWELVLARLFLEKVQFKGTLGLIQISMVCGQHLGISALCLWRLVDGRSQEGAYRGANAHGDSSSREAEKRHRPNGLGIYESKASQFSNQRKKQKNQTVFRGGKSNQFRGHARDTVLCVRIYVQRA